MMASVFSRLRFIVALLGPWLVASASAESARANALFERIHRERVDRSPLLQAQLGIKKDQDQWPDLSEAAAADELARALGELSEVRRSIDFQALDAQTRRSHRLFVEGIEAQVNGYRFRLHNYPVSHNRGLQSTLPSVLVSQHRIDSEADAEAYVRRLRGLAPLFDQLIAGLRLRAERGIVPPRWAFPLVTEPLERDLAAASLKDGIAPHFLWVDFSEKISRATTIVPARKEALLHEARAAVRNEVRGAYGRLLHAWRELENVASDDDGVWKFPDGDAYYAHLVRETTTTSLTPDQVHQIGLNEVARIQDEMRAILPKVGFSGNLRAFFDFVRDDDRFYLPATDEGRAEYVRRAEAFIAEIRGRLPELFALRSDAPVVVRPIPLDRARNAGFASYSRGAADGSRPGVFNVNLYDMRQMPTYQIQALAYHEAVPGHHLQMAVAQEVEGLPSFRRYARYPAYLEGWGLYSEDLPAEIGLYVDPYADFGRLTFQLLRAVRLVADTGIHAKRWSRRKAIDYLLAESAMTEADALRETGRYVTNPTQAISYTIGQIRLNEIRRSAEARLGGKFDLREFHAVVLGQGQLPLDELQLAVGEWVEGKAVR